MVTMETDLLSVDYSISSVTTHSQHITIQNCVELSVSFICIYTYFNIIISMYVLYINIKNFHNAHILYRSFVVGHKR